MNCKTFRSKLPDLLLDPASHVGTAEKAHLATCPPCEQEYTSLIASISAMDAWGAPEPSPYFDQRLAVLVREEQRAPRLGLFARLKDHLLFNTGRQFRPAVAGALALVLTLGGGSYARLQGIGPFGSPARVSATVNDLQILDKNEQALQQMDQLLQEDETNQEDAGAS